jgi:lysophospholipase L1-like esterase
MKRILFIIMIFWNLFSGHCAEHVDWANKARYFQSNQELAQLDDTSRVVLMGNSITEFWEETHPEFFTGNHLVCRGIGGQVSSQMLARFRQDVINLKPRAVVINCGTNDIAENNGPYDEDITMDNIMSMTELAQAHGIIVVLSSVLPTDSFIWNTGVKDVGGKIDRLNRRIIGYCTSRHIPYIDYHTPMRGSGAAMKSAFTDDGVHPNADGYLVMEAKLLEMLKNLELYHPIK